MIHGPRDDPLLLSFPLTVTGTDVPETYQKYPLFVLLSCLFTMIPSVSVNVLLPVSREEGRIPTPFEGPSPLQIRLKSYKINSSPFLPSVLSCPSRPRPPDSPRLDLSGRYVRLGIGFPVLFGVVPKVVRLLFQF